MAPSLKETAEWVLMEEWRRAFPYLDKTTLRLVYPHLTEAALRLHLYPLSENLSDEDRDWYFKTPVSSEERTIIVLADLVVALLFPETIITGLINNAMGEIEEAYRVILQEGGGWSSVGKGSRDQRKMALLEWYQRNQTRLSYLKKSYLEDDRLYEGRGGQEKRDFRDILLIQLIKHVVKQELTFAKVRDYVENLKKSKQPLR
ncbi:MAG: hypothetical protein M0P73_06360 [Syntrophobacterales bacterium]|jgi:hypothetical protein|nr:hypothetical protein [Syntrophobacterales bacterium]